MSSISHLLSGASNSLTAHQSLMQVINQNVSNASTPGYSRQRMQLIAHSVPGMSVSAGALTSVRNAAIQRATLGAEQGLGYNSARSEMLNMVEPAFNDLDGTGLSVAFDEFFGSISELSGTPDGVVQRQQLIAKANALGNSLSSAAETVDAAKLSAEMDAGRTVGEINGLLKGIASLNKEIALLQGTPGGGSELVDQRDQMLQQLAGLVDIQSVARDDGTVAVLMGSGHLLVDGKTVNQLEMGGGGNDPLAITLRKPDGSTLSPPAPAGGKLGGLIEVRDVTLTEVSRRLDQMAFDLASAVNSVHSSGFGLDGSTGNPLFDPITSVEGAAKKLKVSDVITDDPDKLAAAQDADMLPGDSSNMEALLALQEDGSLIDGKMGVSEAYDDIVSYVATALHESDARIAVESQRREHLENKRLSESGVSLQEEMIALTVAERAMQASSKVVQVADELYQTILNMV